MKLSPILYLFAFSLSACSVYDTQDYETTVTVTDVSGKPLAGKAVKVYIEYGNTNSHRPNATPFSAQTTNNAGQVTLNYQLYVDESSLNSAVLVVEDDAVWKTIANASHFYSDIKRGKASLDFKILMDTIGDFKVRLKKTGNTPLRLELGAWNGYTKNYVTRDFFRWNKDNVFVFDSTITMRVYANANFFLNASTSKVTGISSSTVESKRGELSAATYRDSVYTIQFQ